MCPDMARDATSVSFERRVKTPDVRDDDVPEASMFIESVVVSVCWTTAPLITRPS